MPLPPTTLKPLRTVGDIAYNWRRFKLEYESFITGYFHNASDEKKIAILLHFGGKTTAEAFGSFRLTSREKKNLKKVIDAFDNYFLPPVAQERHIFFNRKQLAYEPYEEFLATLQILSASCEFGNLRASIVKDAFISGLKDVDVRDVLLRSNISDVDSALEICRSMEIINERIRLSKKRREKTSCLTWLASLMSCIKKKKKTQSRNEPAGFKHSQIAKTPFMPSFRGSTLMRTRKLDKFKRRRPNVTFNEVPEVVYFQSQGVESGMESQFGTYSNLYFHHSSDFNVPYLDDDDICSPGSSNYGYLRVFTTKALVHREDEPTEATIGNQHIVYNNHYKDDDDDYHDQRDDKNNVERLMDAVSEYKSNVAPLFGNEELPAQMNFLKEVGHAAPQDTPHCLMKGSVTTENKAERPKTLRKLKNVYESAKMSGESEDALVDGKLVDKGVLSPFDEQEEWAKISEIMASFGNLVRESVFITELEKEFQERLGLNLSDSSTSVGVGTISIATWLNSLNLSQYEQVFINFGYDNLDFINGVIDDNDLKEMGVTEDDRKTILEASKSLNNKVSLARNEAINNNNNEEKSRDSVEEWLERLDLAAYWDTFRKHLYTDMDRVKTVWEVELTAVLEISKPGHRHRIMASLPRSPNQPSIQDINAELIQLKSSMQELEGKVVSSSASTTSTATLRHSHKKTRPAPPPPGKPQPDLQIRDPSQLLVGVPSTITAQWRHQPHDLLTGTLTYHARYLGSTVVKVLRGAESTKKSIQKLKKPLSEQNSSPDIYLAISYHGVKFLSGDTKELVCEHEIRNIHLACQDAEDLTHFAYITKDRATKSHYCHVFSVQTMDQATEVILTLGQAFEVAYQMALREANSTKGNGHTRSYSANLTPITTQPNHNRSHSVNEIKLNGENISNGHTSTPTVLMSEDV